MFLVKNPLFNILTCTNCDSSGYIKFKKCPQCKGMSMGVMRRNKFLYWGEPLTKYHINVRKARRILDKFRIIGSLIFALGFLGLFFYFIYSGNLWKTLFSKHFWFGGSNLPILLWLAIIVLMYLFYRLLLLNKVVEIVEGKSYSNKTMIEEDFSDQILQTWVEVLKMPRKNKKNISLVFTNEARQILEQAYLLADKAGSEKVEVEHLFYALLASSKVSTVFLRLGVSIKNLQIKLAKQFKVSQEKVLPILSDDLEQILFNSYEIAYDLHQEYVNVTEILVATIRQSKELQELLYSIGIDKNKLENVVEWLRIRERMRRQYYKFKKIAKRRSKYGLDRAMTAVATPFLNSFSEDLTMAAKYGYITDSVGRDEEVQEIFRIIEAGRQSVVLVGEHGVGKMSIIEGIAQKMVEEDVPDRLKDKRLVQISTSVLLSGVSISEAQGRLIKIMNEVARAKNIILFIKNIDDLVSLVGEQGGVDVAKTLADYLGPGKFLTFATATTENYNQRIVNTQLGTVLARVDIKEMNENQSIQVLESKVGSVEYKHNVFFSYDALEKSVQLAKRFFYEHQLPESAISLMTEVAAYVKNKKGINQLVSGDDVGAVVSQKTGVPVMNITQDESSRLMRLEQVMHEKVIGQEEAVSLIANALRRARVEMRSKNKPIANFLFLGPTGVGKTELAKTIATVYFGGESQMIRIDMSEYQDVGSIYRLIGQPGRQGTGVLTEAVRQKPFSLVLLDELEKASPDILNLFLQVFDDGRLTDSTGRVIDFTNTIIIATSNAGTDFVQEQLVQGVSLENIRQQLLRGELKKYYKPEFINRFDGVVLFKPLNKNEIKQIAGLLLKRTNKDLQERGMSLQVEDTALEALVKIGFDPEYGARPMRRAIQDNVENKIAELILSNKVQWGDILILKGDLEFKIER